MKKIIALIAGALLAAPLAHAQIDTGTSAGQRALDEARSGVANADIAPTSVTVTDYKTASGKEVAVVEEEDKWWSVNASTGWDSLYMFRGVNVLGYGNGLYWLGAGLGVSPWENGTFTANVWYGVGSWWNGSNRQQPYGELDVTVGYAHTFGALTLSTGWIHYYFPNVPAAPNVGGATTSQNEIYFGASYAIEVGDITITPSTTYYYNLGPKWTSGGGLANGGSSYWSFALNSSIPVAYDGAVSLAPYTQFNLNFQFNNEAPNATPFTGGNNWQTGVALPIQFTSWFSVSPYIAYSWSWQNLASPFNPAVMPTSPSTWWGGISANFAF